MGRIQGAEGLHPESVRLVPTPGQPPKNEPPEHYLAWILTQLHDRIKSLSEAIDDRTRPVDEYQVESTESPTGESIIVVQPTFDQISERIESILVTGPASTAFTLQVGGRNFSLLTNASGYVLLAPLGIQLSRNDTRQLTSATSGNWTLELMGWADEHF